MTLVILCAAALLGIALADLRQLSTQPLLATAALAGVGAGLAHGHSRWRGIALCTCAASLGAARGSLTLELPWPSALATSTQALLGAVAPLRTAAQSAISAYLPEPQASLAAGVLLGGSGRLDPAFKQDLQRAGLGHLLAIDGFKQVVVAATIGRVARGLLGPRLALLPTLAAIAGYTLVAGGHPSAVRAALMVTLALVAGLAGRIADPLTSLGLALLAMAALEPRVLLDLGLQLSLSATLGIVLLWPVLRRRLRLYRLPRPIAEAVGLSLAVSLAGLPVTLSVFGLVSLVSPLAHVLAVPLLPLVLIGAALLSVAAHVGPLATAAAWLAWLPTSFLVAVVRAFGSLLGAAIATGYLPVPAAALLAGLLLGWGVWHLPELRERRIAWSHWRWERRHVLWPAGRCAALALAAAGLQLLRPDGRLHVDHLGLARGQAVFIRGPTGQTALVVLGSTDAIGLASQVATRLNVWENRLDSVVALDGGAAKALGPVLAHYPARRILQPTTTPTSVDLDVGGTQRLEIAVIDRELEIRSAPTTSAARPGSAN